MLVSRKPKPSQRALEQPRDVRSLPKLSLSKEISDWSKSEEKIDLRRLLDFMG